MRRPYYGAIQHFIGSAPSTLNDTFTDTTGTTLITHTGESGHTWAYGFGITQTSPAQIADNGVWSPFSSTREYISSWVPASADYYVEVPFQYYTTISDNLGVTGRHQSGVQSYYMAHWSSSAGGWRLLKTLAGVTSQVGTTIFNDTFTSGTRLVRLTMTGTTIKVTIDGVDRITETDSNITLPGSAGLRFALTQSATTGRHPMSIVAQ